MHDTLIIRPAISESEQIEKQREDENFLVEIFGQMQMFVIYFLC